MIHKPQNHGGKLEHFTNLAERKNHLDNQAFCKTLEGCGNMFEWGRSRKKLCGDNWSAQPLFEIFAWLNDIIDNQLNVTSMNI